MAKSGVWSKGGRAGVKRAEADDFVLLYKRDWKVYVSSHALDKLHERKWNQPDSLPKNEDVRRVSETLEYDMREAMEDLEHAPSADSYTRLAQTTLESFYSIADAQGKLRD